MLTSSSGAEEKAVQNSADLSVSSKDSVVSTNAESLFS